MKRIFNVFLIAVMFVSMSSVMVSCSNDDEPSIEEGNSLVGTWKYVSGSLDGMLGSNYTHFIQFNSDNTYVEVEDDAGDVTILYGSWYVSGNKVYIKQERCNKYNPALGITVGHDIDIQEDTFVVSQVGLVATYTRTSSSALNRYRDEIDALLNR